MIGPVPSLVAVLALLTTPEEPPADDSLLTLLEILDAPVTTADGGVEMERSLAPANVISISRAEIDRRGWRSLTEILGHLPGIYLVDDLVSPSVGIRGITGGYQSGTRLIKVMINGVVVNFRPDMTSLIGPEYIPMETVERVEVARGPLSALYGANAFLATVNVITRRPEPGSHGEVAQRAGVRDGHFSSGTSAALSFGSEGVGLLLGFSRDHIDRSGLAPEQTFATQRVNPTIAPIFDRGTSRADISTPLSAFAQLTLKSDRRGILSLQGGAQQRDAMGEFQINSVLTHRNRDAVANYWASASYYNKLVRWLSTRVTLGWSQGAPTRDDRHYLSDNGQYSYIRHFDYTAVDGAAELKAELSWLTTTLSVDGTFERQTVLYYSQVVGTDEGERKAGDMIELLSERDTRRADLANFGASLQGSGAPFSTLPGLRLAGNLRVDRPNLYPIQTSWRASVANRFSDVLVGKVIAGKAYQAPSAVLLYGLPGFGSSQIIGNRVSSFFAPLRPQTIHSLELAVSVLLGGHLALEGALFAQQLDSKIEFVPFGTNFIARNASMERTLGAELSASAVISRLRPYLTASLDRGLAKDPITGSTQLVSEPLPVFPSAMVHGGVAVEVPEAHLQSSLDARWVGERGASSRHATLNGREPYVLPASWTADFQLSSMGLSILGPGTDTRLTAAVRNLFDRRYSSPGYAGFDIPSMGRSFFFELRQKL
jgi:outer membrane receptor protein involved in Fe transport